MNKGVKDYTLLERTISTLMSVRELRVAPCRDSQSASRPLKAPSVDHLDFGDTDPKRTSPKPAARKHGKVKPDGPPRPVENQGGEKPSWGWRAARLVAYLLVAVGAIVFNEFYGYPLRGSRWLKLETYRAAIEYVWESDGAFGDGAQQSRRINVTGIAYSSDKPSAMIGDRIVHVGDVVSDATIMRIGPREVVFRVGDHTWTEKVH